MDLFEVSPAVLEANYNRMGHERIDFLVDQAKEQIKEISQDQETLDSYLKIVGLSEKVDDLVLWVILMSNDDVCFGYNKKFNKGFMDFIPMNDLSDLSLYLAYKNKNEQINGIEKLIELDTGCAKEIDHHCVSSLLYYIQQEKQQMDF